MKTKVIVLIAACLAGTFISQAQTKKSAAGTTTFGIRAGVNFQNLNGKFAGSDLDNKIKVGFNAGVNAEIPIADEFYLQPGLLFSSKGAKADNNSDTKVNINYLELPVNVVYKTILGTGNLLLGAGPYAAYALGGKIKTNNGNVDLEFDSNLKPGEILKYGYTFKRFDFGANLLVGYEFSNKFSAQLNAQLGLANISPKIDGLDKKDYRTKNTGFGISLGYRL
ncbi:porin family protein [Paraflavitalea speifideaquila]|uniref:porin family protein n=1 Tax=Paraflavitalea speifideaquila TaxID=3076558 RepID=UPI0028EF0896|nr:porin family protein [Paraflavitalea speifideiaquila]